jgi:hypothetical protein
MASRRSVDPANWLYGTMVTASLFTLAGVHPGNYERLLALVVLTLAMYWLSHVYVRVVENRIGEPGRPFFELVWEALRHESPMFLGGVPAVITYLVFVIAGFSSHAAIAAIWVSVAMLGFIGYRIGVRVGATGIRLVGEAVACSVFGLVLIGLKVFLH